MPDIEPDTFVNHVVEEVTGLLLEASGLALCARSITTGCLSSQVMPILSDARPLVRQAQVLIDACFVLQHRQTGDEPDAARCCPERPAAEPSAQ